MDGKDRSSSSKHGVILVNGFQVSRDQAGLPFVVMDDVGGETDVLGQEECSPRKENEAFRIVEIIPPGCAVKGLSVVILVRPMNRQGCPGSFCRFRAISSPMELRFRRQHIGVTPEALTV
jgi:hypothetical protein